MFGFGKKKKSKVAKQSKKTNDNGDKPVVRRKKHLFGGSGANYPVIRALKIPEQVPSAILDVLASQAKDKDGAVRKVNGGYTVITLDEKTLEEQHLVPKSKTSDFGQFSASLRKPDNITSTTLKGDMDSGNIVMAPNQHTLESLDEFDQLRDGAQFGWAVFPENIEDDDLDAHVQELGNTVDLADLTQISENEWDLSVSNNKMVVDQSDPDESDDEDYDEDDDYDTSDDYDDDEYESSDDEYEPADDDTQEYESQDDGDANQQQDQQQPSDASPEEVQNAQAAFDHPDDNPQNDQAPDQDPSEPPASLESSSSSNALNNDPEFWSRILHGSVPSDGPQQQAQAQQNDNQPPQLNPNGQMPQPNSNALPPRPQDANQQAVSFQNTVGTVGLQQLYDQDLGLTVDTSVFNQMFDASMPFTVSPLSVPTESTELFTKVVNEARADANTKLSNLNNRHRQQLISEYINRVQQMIVTINKRLELDNQNTNVGQAKRIIESTYHEKLNNRSTDTKDAEQQLRNDYEARREEAGQQAMLQAKQAFDEQNRSHLNQEIQQVSDRVTADITDERISALHDLNQRRKQAATLTYKDVNSKILQEMQGMFEQMRNDEADLANTYQNNLQQTMDRLYRDDVKRQQAMAETNRHDSTIEQLQAEKNRLVEDNQNALDSLKSQNQSELETLSQRYNDNRNQLVKSYNAKIDEQVKQLQKKDKDYQELQNDITNQLAQRTEDVKSQYEEQLEHMQRRYDDARADLQAARDTINANLQEYQTREQSYNMQVEQAQKAQRRSPFWAGVSMLAVGVFVTASLFVGYNYFHGSSNNVRTSQQSSGNSGSTPTININGVPSSSNSSSNSSNKNDKDDSNTKSKDNSKDAKKDSKSSKSKSDDKRSDSTKSHVSVNDPDKNDK